MRKISIAIVVFFVAVIGAKAQTAAPSTKVQLNVILTPMLSLEIGQHDQGANGDYADVVNLEYKTAKDYNDGVSKTLAGHLKATSIGSGFKVYASASSSNLNRVSGGNEQLTGDLVTVKVGSGQAKVIRDMGNKAGKVGTNAEDMGFGFQTGSTGSVIAKELDVTYAGASLKDKLDLLKNNNGQKVTYTVDVLYSIIAQ